MRYYYLTLAKLAIVFVRNVTMTCFPRNYMGFKIRRQDKRKGVLRFKKILNVIFLI
jgi:hypothetical protein